MGLALLVLSASCRWAKAAPSGGTSVRGGDDPRPAPTGRAVDAPRDVVARFLVRASATLFEQGLADPRGGDYRAIEIAVGSVWSSRG